MRSLGVVFALLVLACNSSPMDPGSSVAVRDATIVVQFGNSNQVNTDLRVSFAQVVEDSRCPASVVCVWQGNGAIRLDITTGRGAQSATLNTAAEPAFPVRPQWPATRSRWWSLIRNGRRPIRFRCSNTGPRSG